MKKGKQKGFFVPEYLCVENDNFRTVLLQATDHNGISEGQLIAACLRLMLKDKTVKARVFSLALERKKKRKEEKRRGR